MRHRRGRAKRPASIQLAIAAASAARVPALSCSLSSPFLRPWGLPRDAQGIPEGRAGGALGALPLQHKFRIIINYNHLQIYPHFPSVFFNAATLPPPAKPCQTPPKRAKPRQSAPNPANARHRSPYLSTSKRSQTHPLHVFTFHVFALPLLVSCLHVSGRHL